MAAASGDLTAFETLYRQFAPRIYGLCLRLTGQREAAEDCTQESFVAAWRALGRFESRSRFSTWMQRIAIRTVFRGAGGCASRGRWASPRRVSLTCRPRMVRRRSISSARSPRCPNGARDVLVLVGIYGYSHSEAAGALGVAEGTCKAQLHRARGLLSEALGLETA